MDLQKKVELMTTAAFFDVSEEDMFFEEACRDVKNTPGKVPKVFMSNDCAFNCQYCACRRSNENKRPFTLTPAELADIAVKGARTSGCGIFLTSAVYRNADYTQELINRTIQEIRTAHGYNGYIHAKIMPGADMRLIYQAGRLANRLSVNIEIPHSSGYAGIASQKSRANILGPMAAIHGMINEYRSAPFARSQITQLMIGAMGEDDRTIMSLSQAIYKKYNLSRVYYSAFTPVQETNLLPTEKTPLWRRNRVYQADRLLANYNMTADELLPKDSPYLECELDPKTAYALRNLDRYPVEINSADQDTLLRTPGIGPAGAAKIIAARKHTSLEPEHLRKMRLSTKTSIHFLTFNGKYYGLRAYDPVILRLRLKTTPVRPVQLEFV